MTHNIIKKETDMGTVIYGYCDDKGDNFTWHRDEKDGPAVIKNNGTYAWVMHGKLHRENGPALINKNGTEWYFYGKYVTIEIEEWLDQHEIEDYSKITEEDKLALSFYMRLII